MTTPFRGSRRILASSILSILAGFGATAAHAASGDWILTSGGGWGTAANWNPAAVPGSAAGDIVNINTNIGAAAAITLDANRTLGTLLLGDSDTTHAFSLTGNTLILDQTATGTALVRFGTPGGTAAIGNSIASAITLADNARLFTTLSASQGLTGTISGAFSLTFDNDDGITPAGPVSGQGQFLVNNTNPNTYSLGTTIDDVRVQIQGNNAALGTGAVNILDGGQVYVATALSAIANTFNIAGNGWQESAGQLGAMRLDSGAIVTGAVNLTANAAIGSNSGVGTVSGVIGGAFNLTKVGVGNLTLSGANTYSSTTIANGTLQLNNNAAAGAGPINLVAGGTTNIMTRLMLNGGVTIANTINIGATAGLAGQGNIQQTGTGLATVTGAINITGSPVAGGLLVGGNATGNALVLSGPITSSVSVTQRDGFVRYSGGGTGYTSLGVTGTAQVGATNGISTAANVNIGVSGTATLDMNGFDQSLAGLTFGTLTTSNQGNVALGTRTLTLTGDVSVLSNTTQNVTHSITAGTGGTLAVGASTRTINVTNNLAVDDLAITGAAITGDGIIKDGAGTLALSGVNVAGTLTVNAGTLQTGRFNAAGNLTTGTLAFGPAATTLKIKVGATNDLITTGTLTTAGTTTVQVAQVGGVLANGTYPLIDYTGASPGLGGLVLAPTGHLTGTLVDSGTSIGLQVTGNDRVIWDGTSSTAWSTAATGNWKLQTGLTATDYIESDDVIFQDAPVNNNVVIAANVAPSNVTFTNTTATTYNVSGAGGIIGTTGLTKTGNGTVILSTPNSYTGATTISAGTLELDFDPAGNNLLTGTSGVSIATGATLRMTRDGTATATTTTFNRSLSGSGTVDVNMRTGATGTVADSLVLSGTNSGFTGTVRLLSPATGTYRIQAAGPALLGSGTIEVQNGAQVYAQAGGTYNNSITITGTGFADSAGNIGALRLENTAVWAGPINVNGTARIGSHNGTATVSGPISGGDLTVNATNFNNGYTLVFTGSNTYGTTTIGGQNVQTAGVPSMRLNIGNGGTTGTLGSGNVTIHGDGANGVLGFDRSDGYTLLPGQTITGATGAGTIANSIQRTFIDIDTLGAGFNDNGNTITLGTAAVGGNLRVGQTRTGAIANLSGAWTLQNVFAGSATRSTTNLNSGAVVNAGTVHVARTGGTGSVLNINAGSTLNVATQFNLGEQAANNSGFVNQNGGAVSVGQHMRIAHWSTETSVYNLAGGTLTLPTASAFPFFSTTNETNGGVYLGIDGVGIMNHTGGTLTTGFIVLDNRAETVSGTNMPSGNETYNLSGGTLVFNSIYGFVSRYATTNINLNSGTIQAGAGISPNFDTTRIAVGGPVTIDTNGANTFTAYGPLAGTGTFNLTGGGTFRTQDSTGATTTTLGSTGTGNGGSLGSVGVSIGASTTLQANRTGTDVWAGPISGSGALAKLNTGSLSLTGSGTGFTGNVTVTQGRLDVPSNLAAGTITVADAASFGGETSTTAVNLGTTTGANLFINGSTAGALTATNLTLNGTTTVDFAVAPASTASPITVLNYTSLTGTPTFALANAASYRPGAAFDTSVPGTVTLSLVTKALTWTGTGGTTWNVNTTQNWNDSTPAPDFFFAGDTVTFDDSSTNTGVTVSPGVAPFKTTVNSSTSNYTLTSSGAGIAGAGSLEKSGASTLTLVGANTYAGPTVLNGGNVNIAVPTSLGNASATNSIVFNGGQLTPTAAMNLGATRSMEVGAGGGTISAAGAGAYTVTVPGNLTGSGALTLTAGSTAAPTYVLSGNNSAFTGTIHVNSVGLPAAATAGTTLVLASNTALTGGTVNLAFPTGLTANGVNTTLSLAGVTISGTTLAMTSNFNTVSQRTQLNTTAGTNTWNGPITLAGTDIIQLSTAHVLNINGDVTGAGHTGTFFLRGGSPGLGALNGIINSPTSNLSKTDSGTWTINSTGNTWNNTGVFVGVLALGATNAFPTGTTVTMGQNDTNAATLDLRGFDQTVGGLAHAVGASGVRQITNSAATMSVLTLDTAGTSTYGTGGVAILSGNLQLVKNGTGTLALGGTNTYTGGTLLNAGTIRLNGTTSSFGPATSFVTAADGTTVDANGQNVPGASHVGTLTIQGSGVGGLGAIRNSGAGVTNNPFFNNLVLTGDTTIGTNSRYDLAGPAVNGGTFTLTKIGTGETWWSPAAGASIGDIAVNAGTFGVQISNNLGSDAHSIIVNAGAQVQTFGAITNSKPVILNGGQLAANNNTSTWTGPLSLNGAGITNRLGTVTAGVGVVWNGPITGNGFEKIGTGTLSLGNAANSYTGDTRVTAGTLTVSAAGKLSPASALDLNGGTVDLAGTTQTVAGLRGATGTITSTLPAVLTANQTADSTYGGALNGSVTLFKDGPGTLTLAGTSLTTGATVLTAGGLTVNGSLSGSAVTVVGGTLSGIGTTGDLLLANGILSPGTPVGTLNTAGLTLGAGTFAETITGASTHGQVSVTGSVVLSGNPTLTLDFTTYDPVDNVDSFTLIQNDAADPLTLGGNSFIFGGNPIGEGAIFTAISGANSQLFQITYAGGSDNNDVVLHAIPEPASALMLLGGFGTLLAARRLRRRSA